MGFAALPLPIIMRQPREDPDRFPFRRLERVQRRGPVLRPGPNADLPHLKSLDLTDSCLHGCAFCFAQSPTKTNSVLLFADTAACLKAELRHQSRRPKAVYISPNTDPFPPLGEVQAEASRVIQVLMDHGVDTWLMTRGYIRPAALRTLAKCRDRLRVTIPLTTMDRSLQRMLEPWSAPPRLRLRQIDRLHRLGIKVQVSLEPLVPGLTDTKTNLAGVLEALAAVGVQHVQASYMFLRPGMQESLRQKLEPYGRSEVVLDAFAGGPLLQAGTVRTARYLPKKLRQRGYAALMAQAAELGMTISVNGAANPDFRPSSPAERASTCWQQPLLPAFAGNAG